MPMRRKGILTSSGSNGRENRRMTLSSAPNTPMETAREKEMKKWIDEKSCNRLSAPKSGPPIKLPVVSIESDPFLADQSAGARGIAKKSPFYSNEPKVDICQTPLRPRRETRKRKADVHNATLGTQQLELTADHENEAMLDEEVVADSDDDVQLVEEVMGKQTKVEVEGRITREAAGRGRAQTQGLLQSGVVKSPSVFPEKSPRESIDMKPVQRTGFTNKLEERRLEMMKTMRAQKLKPTGGKRQSRKKKEEQQQKEEEGQRLRGRTMQRGSRENEENRRWNDEGNGPVRGTRRQLSGDVDDGDDNDFEKTAGSGVGELTASKNPSNFNSHPARTSYNRAAKSNSHTSESYKNCIQTDGSDDKKKKNKIDLDTLRGMVRSLQLQDREEGVSPPHARFPPALPSRFTDAYSCRSLTNNRNSCFMNSTLQALSVVDDCFSRLQQGNFRYKKIFDEQGLCDVDSATATYRLLYLILSVMRGCEGNSYQYQMDNILMEFRKNVAKCTSECFNNGRQMDAEEFMLAVVNRCDELIVKMEKELTILEGRDEPTEDEIREVQQCYSIKMTFKFSITRCLHCNDCQKEPSFKSEEDTELRLPLNEQTDSADVQQLIDQLSSPSLIEFEKKLCRQTRNKLFKIERSFVTSFPSSLILHLKRYNNDKKLKMPVLPNRFIYTDRIFKKKAELDAEEAETKSNDDEPMQVEEKADKMEINDEAEKMDTERIVNDRRRHCANMKKVQRSQSQDSIKFLGVVESTSAYDSVNHKFNPLSHEERKALLEQIAPGMIGQYNIGMNDKAASSGDGDGESDASIQEYKVIKTTGDGNCFFNSLCWWMTGQEDKTIVELLRARLHEFLDRHRQIFEKLDDKDFDATLEKTAKSGEWSDTMQVFAAATMLRTPILICDSYIVDRSTKWHRYDPRFSLTKDNEPNGPMNREFYQKQSAIYLRNPRSEIHFEPVTAKSKQNDSTKKNPSKEQLPEEQLDLSRVTQDTPAYELAAVIVHSGYTVRSGHYMTYIKSKERKKWLLCNDRQITEITSIANMRWNSREDGYVLLYTRIDDALERYREIQRIEQTEQTQPIDTQLDSQIDQ